MNSITNCNLESEYDLKILDPNFVKLFRLAQLLIDFLLHCKQYLEKCIKVAHESLQTSNKEIEELKLQVVARKSEVKNLKKKVKEVKQQLLECPRFSNQTFRCCICGKLFMSEEYLESHQSRRHVFPLSLKPATEPVEPSKVSVHHEENKTEQKSERVLGNLKKKYQDEIEELKAIFFAEIEKIKENNVTSRRMDDLCVDNGNSTNAVNDKLLSPKVDLIANGGITNDLTNFPLSESTKKLRSEVINEVDRNVEKVSEFDNEWRCRLEERESVWRARMCAQDDLHKQQVQKLLERLDLTQLQGQEMKKDLERRLEEVMYKFEQTQKEILHEKNRVSERGKPREECTTVLESNSEKHHNGNRSIITTFQVKDNSGKIEPHVPPFYKRKAFVSQKSKTIQEDTSFEQVGDGKTNSDVVKVIQTLDSSEDESDIVQNENAANVEGNQSSIFQMKSGSPKLTNNQNKENITTVLEKEQTSINSTKRSAIDSVCTVVDEFSISETTTETDSETEPSDNMTSEGNFGLELRRQNRKQCDILMETNIVENVNPDESKQISNKSNMDNISRSITNIASQSRQSMEAVLTTNPTILQQLRGDLQELVDRRLRALGMDPTWIALPSSTFHKKIALLAHQRQITAKNHKVYFTLREKLNQDAELAVRKKPPKSMTESLLARLRKKASPAVNEPPSTLQRDATRNNTEFTKNTSYTEPTQQPLASSSPRDTGHTTIINSNKFKTKTTFKDMQRPSSEDSHSLSSTLSDQDTEDDPNLSRTQPGVYKSALRNAVSTSNLTKKKVLFLDDAINSEKRSSSENTIAVPDGFASRMDNVSISSLVQEIQQQLSHRSGKPAYGVDLGPTTALPLSQILPLSRSGRELLEQQEAFMTSSPLSEKPVDSSVNITNVLETKLSNLTSPHFKLFQSTSEALPATSRPTPPLRKPSNKSGFPLDLTKPMRQQYEHNKPSPSHSLSSVGSSVDSTLLPVPSRRRRTSLELDLQDLEDNLKD